MVAVCSCPFSSAVSQVSQILSSGGFQEAVPNYDIASIMASSLRPVDWDQGVEGWNKLPCATHRRSARQARLGRGVGWEMARVPWESTDCRARTVTVCHVAGFLWIAAYPQATA